MPVKQQEREGVPVKQQEREGVPVKQQEREGVPVKQQEGEGMPAEQQQGGEGMSAKQREGEGVSANRLDLSCQPRLRRWCLAHSSLPAGQLDPTQVQHKRGQLCSSPGATNPVKEG